MDATRRVLVPQVFRTQLSTLLFAALGALVALPALAGPLNPSHRFERIGGGLSDVSAMLPMGDGMRVLLLQRTGDLHLVTGDGLVDDAVAHVEVRTDCGEQGLLSGTWAPDEVGQTLFVTYVSASTGFFTVGRIDFDENLRASEPTVVWQARSAAGCDNLGGGIAFHVDGTLLVGTGDNGNPAAAGQITSSVGKILRFTAAGLPPNAPLTPNPFGAAPTYSMGVRNPVRLVADSATGEVWFVDLGPGENDELNLLQGSINYGWNGSMQTGRLGLGDGDPMWVWPTPVVPSGIAAYRGAPFKDSGNVFVAASDGIISEVFPNRVDPTATAEQVVFIPDLDGPQVLKDLVLLPDGMIYVVDDAGGLWRLVEGAASPTEPGNRASVVPTLLQKTATGSIELSVERAGATEMYGLFVGDLNTLASGGYNHGIDLDGDGVNEEAEIYLDQVSSLNGPDTAWSRFELQPSDLNGVSSAYVLLSARTAQIETRVGFDRFDVQRPGGDRTFSCDAGCDTSGYGTGSGQCMEETPLELVLQDDDGDGVPTGLGRLEATEEGDCKVTLLLLGAEWCPPCQAEAPHVQGLVETYGADRLEVISVMHEDRSYNPADQAAVERWIAAYDLTYKVVADPSASVISNWSGCSGIPQSYLFDEDGHQTDFFCGYNASALDAAVGALLD